jgi:hypothetical protein
MIQGEYTHGDSNVRRCFLGQVISFPQKHERNSLCAKENVRNVNCKHYLTCLDAAALVNTRNLGCENCRFRTDNTYKMTVRDFKGLMRLYCEIMSPEVTEFVEGKK